jgi:purine-nucleoside phosphorylase
MDLPTLDMYDESVTFLQGRLPDQLRRPQVAIICGSGLGLLAETVEHNGKLSVSFDYASVPHFPHSTGMTPCPRSTLFDSSPNPILGSLAL